MQSFNPLSEPLINEFSDPLETELDSPNSIISKVSTALQSLFASETLSTYRAIASPEKLTESGEVESTESEIFSFQAPVWTSKNNSVETVDENTPESAIHQGIESFSSETNQIITTLANQATNPLDSASNTLVANTAFGRPPHEYKNTTNSNDYQINALLGPRQWDMTTITYSFFNSNSYNYESKSLSPLTATIRNHVRNVIENIIEPLINVNFVEVPDYRVGSRISFGTLRYAFAEASPNIVAYARYPGNSLRNGDIHLNSVYANSFENGRPGTRRFETLIHETLHALGLKHPGNYNGSPGSGTPPFLPDGEDNSSNTLLSYNRPHSKAITAMPLDIKALQYLYGARANNSGNTTYNFDTVYGYSVNGESFGSTTSPLKQTIWDSGGFDTLNFSNLANNNSGYRFDLTEGGFLTTNQAYNGTSYDHYTSRTSHRTHSFGTAIAYNTIIERAIGTSSNDTILGNDANNYLYGGAGDDIIRGGRGNDYIDGQDGNDNLYGGDGNDRIIGWQGNDTIYGYRGNDALAGGDGNDYLNGGSGNDEMYGGDGNDRYVVDSASDTVTEYANQGIDTVLSSINYTLGDNLENLELTGNARFGYGNSLANNIYGNSGSNTLVGYDGNDWIEGRDGNDSLYGGNDNDSLNGGDGNDYLNGSNGNDILNGGSGNDRMEGGDGNDRYIVDSSNDIVNELANQGIDTVLSSVSYTLGDHLENLELIGTAYFGVGNNLNNIIEGNDSNNRLSGLGGRDRIYGGDGLDYIYGGDDNDLLYGQGGRDRIYGGDGLDYIYGGDDTDYLYGNAGNDRIFGGDGNDYLIGDEGDDYLYGQAGDDYLNGSEGNDYLNGGTGDDSMYGREGNDRYIVDSSNDTVIEAADQGTDTVYSSVNYTLGDNLENLRLSGNATRGYGNSLDNNIYGTSADNRLAGYAGNDRLYAYTGDDIVYGGEGDDYLYGGDGSDDLYGQADNDYLSGGDGNDYLNGGTGNDQMIGGDGNDYYMVDSSGDVVTEAVGQGTDTVYSYVHYNLGANLENLRLFGNTAVLGMGNELDNNIIGNAINNVLFGQNGDDILDGRAGDDFLNGGMGNDTLNGGIGNDNLYGGFGNDLINGGVGDDTLNGEWGDDILNGEAGNDYLLGGFGNDLLNGGEGVDTLHGGEGEDTFAFDALSDGIDFISDFNVVDDMIRIASSFGGGLVAGALEVSAFHIGSAATAASHRLIFDNTTGALSFDADGSGIAATQTQFATLSAGLALTQENIVVA
jgi:Ca2+-binding RTX toxin-like protein